MAVVVNEDKGVELAGIDKKKEGGCLHNLLLMRTKARVALVEEAIVEFHDGEANLS